jgi:hypothetical protein
MINIINKMIKIIIITLYNYSCIMLGFLIVYKIKTFTSRDHYNIQYPFYLYYFSMWSHYFAQAGLELVSQVILLPQSLE